MILVTFHHRWWNLFVICQAQWSHLLQKIHAQHSWWKSHSLLCCQWVNLLPVTTYLTFWQLLPHCGRLQTSLIRLTDTCYSSMHSSFAEADRTLTKLSHTITKMIRQVPSMFTWTRGNSIFDILYVIPFCDLDSEGFTFRATFFFPHTNWSI